VNKKQLLITIIAGVISFAGAFAFGWLTRPAPIPAEAKNSAPNHPAVADANKPESETAATNTAAASDAEKIVLTEKQLKSLVLDVREKMKEYNRKLRDLESTEQRLQIAQDVLKKDIEKLNNLRIELASSVARLKEEQNKLLASRVQVEKAEKDNLLVIAATYDKMDSSSAAKILTNMCSSPTQTGGVSSFDDAVKILRYMTERSKAKVLAELAASEPKLAAGISQKLKLVIEKE
jgi:flagellar motility protein MotE (MotC chaperone)